MSAPLLATKLYIPPPRATAVARQRLSDLLQVTNQPMLTLVSAPAGFGKTTVVSRWLADTATPAGWLSLDERDNDPTRFLTYLFAAIQSVAPQIGHGALSILQKSDTPPIEAILTACINDLSAYDGRLHLVLDDFHLIANPVVGQALGFLVEHCPPQLRIIIITREDPPLPLARLRARGQLTELRAADLRFTLDEAAEFLMRGMGLSLNASEIAALEHRTEGWIAGLQLAAISLQKQKDVSAFIDSFTGSHRYVIDYLLEEVLHQQPPHIYQFLTQTSVLDRFCAELCDAVVAAPNIVGAEVLAYLEQANLFLVPLDNARRWYRYHHLFGDLLQQRLAQHAPNDVKPAALHIRASIWYEQQGFELDAFQHAVAADDIARAARLVEGDGMPLLFRGAIVPVHSWLQSLSAKIMNQYPVLWVLYGSALLFVGQLAEVPNAANAAEAALADAEMDERNRDLIGHIAAVRAAYAITQFDLPGILANSQRALDYLSPRNLPVLAATKWSLAVAYHMQQNSLAAEEAYREAIIAAEAIGHYIIHISATIGLANCLENRQQWAEAAAIYRQAMEIAGEPLPPVTCEAVLGLARIARQQGDRPTARRLAEQSLPLARQLINSDRFIGSELFLAQLDLEDGNVDEAAATVDRIASFVNHHHLTHRQPEVAHLREAVKAAGKPGPPHTPQSSTLNNQALIEPLTARELEILQLVAAGLSNRAISDRLFLALSTVKGHNRHIFDKLQVQRRTEAVARARALGLL